MTRTSRQSVHNSTKQKGLSKSNDLANWANTSTSPRHLGTTTVKIKGRRRLRYGGHSWACSIPEITASLAGNEGIRALHIPFKGVYRVPLPSFPTTTQPEKRKHRPPNPLEFPKRLQTPSCATEGFALRTPKPSFSVGLSKNPRNLLFCTLPKNSIRGGVTYTCCRFGLPTT